VSAKGIERLKVELCRLIKEAAQSGTIGGDEPLLVLVILSAKMLSEVRDEKVRNALTSAISTLLPEMVEMYTKKKYTMTIVEELLH
jgi:hypothetical protein